VPAADGGSDAAVDAGADDATDPGGSPSAAACIGQLRWGGNVYLAAHFPIRVQPGQKLEVEGTAPTACGDTGEPSSDPGEQPVGVRSIEGVDPQVALLVDDRAESESAQTREDVFFAEGYPVDVPSHPLFEEVEGARPEERERWPTCDPEVELKAVVTQPPSVAFPLEIESLDAPEGKVPPLNGLVIDSSTAITGLDERGTPRLLRGQEILIVVQQCHRGGLRLGFANAIRPA
jgi:hypothetical protein